MKFLKMIDSRILKNLMADIECLDCLFRIFHTGMLIF